MQNILWSSAFLIAVMPLQAAEQAKPNMLTPKEVADGWILLFDGKTVFGWDVRGDPQIADGIISLGSEKRASITTTTLFGSFELAFQYRLETGAANLILHHSELGLFQSKQLADAQGWMSCVWNVEAGGQSHRVSNEFRGPSEAKRSGPSDPKPGGRTAIGFSVPANGKLMLRSVKLKPAGLESIFNGKDLTGWKEFPARKSKFSVTPEGWINIKNGPGDLQTEGQWADFILQIDCFSNGDRLNSGVFFRCIPDQYQNGYEAQIHNGFLEPPGKEYTLEEYDPKTHKLVNKKKAMYTAIDYGTGAIYRRQPARFQAAKDREWFTMTVAAHGNHMAVWVNGLQVTDWTDNRPPSDNARNGCKVEKGPISLQGHDPTTDLNFRNIRIAELPKAAKRE